MHSILIAEDDQNTREGLVELLSDEGYDVTGVNDGESAYEIARNSHFEVLLTDMKMPGINGLNLIKRIAGSSPQTSIIMMTAFATVETAVKAMRDGAFSYLTKPLKVEELLATIEAALQEKKHKKRSEGLSQASTIPGPNIIGKSSQIKRIFQRVEKVAKANTTVLLLGESGTGKSLIARAIHTKSYRQDRPFIDVSCASIPETLLESELFGTEKGAYTGALDKTRKGYFERAEGGTIFLDEIGEISEMVQVKLLRVLQERRFERLGGAESLNIDVRVIAATNRNLEDAVAEGRYRQDLFYRLNVIPIVVPPLRDHREDIPLLIDHFIQKYTTENSLGIKTMSEGALEICMNYDWPGNIREVENAVESAVVLSDGDSILPEHLPNVVPVAGIISANASHGSLRDSKGHAEKLVIQKALMESGGNRTRAAEALGVTVRTIQYKIKKYEL
tara:strand:- start:26373 stop:27716 length:1344 start_codon:yes stop_codon:yes gene_type:complete